MSSRIFRILSQANESNTTEHHDFAVHAGKDPSFIGILVVVALLFGIVFHTALKKLPVPFTVLALGLGIFLGELMNWTENGLGALADSIENWQNLLPNTMLILFLPILIFESASNIDVHVFSKALKQILLLAIPGVIVNVGLIYIVARYILPYDWNFTQCVIFGAMFSATDPVAVVSLLRELGAPSSLSMLIEGESLLNDGVAFVIFLYMVDVLRGSEGSIVGFIGSFFYASGIGVLVGAGLGHITTFISKIVFDDTMAQINLTIVGAFGTFFIAEGILEASGVLALVAFGLVYAEFRHGGLSVPANEALNQIWEAMVFGANVVIFVYSGFIIVYYIHTADTSSEIGGREWGYLFLLYALLNVIRAVAILLLYPALQRTGYGINLKWSLVMSWGGLRGAVGLALGLILVTDPQINRNFSTKTMFYISGIVGLTLIINAVTTGPLVQYLHLNRTTKASHLFYQRAVELITDHIKESVVTIKRSTRYQGANWNQVWKHVPILDKEMKRTVQGQMGRRRLNRMSRQVSSLEDGVDVEHVEAPYELNGDDSSSEIMNDARERFLNLVKSSYYRDFKDGAVTSKSYISLLIDSATTSQEESSTPLSDWKELEDHCIVPNWYRKVGVPFARNFLLTRFLSVSYQLASAFVVAHESVGPLFTELVNNEHISKTILEESNSQVKKATELLCHIEAEFPDIIKAIKTRQVTEQILKGIVEFSEDLLEHGEIEDKERKSIALGVHRSKAHFWFDSFKPSKSRDQSTIFENSELFIDVNEKEIECLLKCANECYFRKDENLQHEKNQAEHLILIIHGTVSVQAGKRSYRLQDGSIINSLSCVTEVAQTFTYKATSDVRAYQIPISKIKKALHDYPGSVMEKNLYFRASVEAAMSVALDNIVANPYNVTRIMDKGKVVRTKDGDHSERDGGLGILFEGTITDEEGETRRPLCGFSMNEKLKFDENAVYYHLPQEASWMLNTYQSVNTRNLQRAPSKLCLN